MGKVVLMLGVLLGLLPVSAQAELWSGVLSASHGIDWTHAGADPTIMNAPRTQCGPTINAADYATPTAPWTSGAAITTQINACFATYGDTANGGYLDFGPGVFHLLHGFAVKSGVVLRGRGADQTILVMHGQQGTGGITAQCSLTAVMCLSRNGSFSAAGTAPHTAQWVGGLTKGSTQLIVNSVTGTNGIASLTVGDLLGLDQADDANNGNTTTPPIDVPDNNNIWFCWNGVASAPICTGETAAAMRGVAPIRRNNVQIVTVTGIDTVSQAPNIVLTITPGVYMPNIVTDRKPEVWWSGSPGNASNHPATNLGIEDLTIDVSQMTCNQTPGPCPFDSNPSTPVQIFEFDNVRHAWVTGVRFVNNQIRANRCIFCSNIATHVTIRNNYVIGANIGTDQTYGTELKLSSDMLVENNLMERVAVGLPGGNTLAGSVMAYNYTLNGMYTINTNWMQPGLYNHASGHNYTLYEGNDVSGFEADAIHGPSFFSTLVRNRLQGFDQLGGSQSGKTQMTTPAYLSAFNRYFAFMGNVMGKTGLHVTYENYPALTTTLNNGGGHDDVIYQIGWSGNQGTKRNSTVAIGNDIRVRPTLTRWGNWDVVSGTRWCGTAANTGWVATCGSASEIPATDAYYPTTVPATETVPNSFYLSAKPAWFGPRTWPPFGPDVTGGDITVANGAEDIGGHGFKIPARVCYESMAADTAKLEDGVTLRWPALSDSFGHAVSVKRFNAATCLNMTPPVIPTFGNTSIGSQNHTSTLALPLWSKFTFPALNGRTMSKITAYLADATGASFTLGGAVYANSGGLAGAKLCEDTGNVTVSTSTPAWYEIPISCPVTSGQVLWLALWPNTANRMTYSYEPAGGTLNYKNSGPAFEAWPDPNTGTITETWALSIYGTVNAIASELEPPSDMANLVAGATTSTTQVLTWNAGTDAQGAVTSSIELCAGTGCTNFATYATGLSSPATLTGLTQSTLYRVRGWHVDTDGNVSVNKSSIVTFTTAVTSSLVPPAAPTGLHFAGASTGTSVTLVWNANTEADLAGYYVYQSATQDNIGVRVATKTPASAASTHSSLTQYIATVPHGGTIYFTVSAFDTDGNESAVAAQVSRSMAGMSARTPATSRSAKGSTPTSPPSSTPTFTFVDKQTCTADAGSTSLACTALNTPAGADIEVCWGWESNPINLTVPTDTAGNTYTLRTQQRYSAGEPYVRCAYVFNALPHAANVITAHWDGSAAFRRGGVMSFTYIGTISTDAEIGSTEANADLTPSSDPLSTSGATSLCIGAHKDYTAQTISSETINGVARDGEVHQSDFSMFYKIFSTTLAGGTSSLTRTATGPWVQRLSCNKVN